MLCVHSSTNPRLCMWTCQGSVAEKWALAARKMVDNGTTDGGGHTRMLSGDLIWCSACGAYADTGVNGLKHPCTGKHSGTWHGCQRRGRRAQLKQLFNNVHPVSGKPLPPPVAETNRWHGRLARASETDLHEIAQAKSRYSCKDKAVARQHAADPLAVLTAEKTQYIENKKREAIDRARRKQEAPAILSRKRKAEDEGLTSTQKKAKIFERIRARIKLQAEFSTSGANGDATGKAHATTRTDESGVITDTAQADGENGTPASGPTDTHTTTHASAVIGGVAVPRGNTRRRITGKTSSGEADTSSNFLNHSGHGSLSCDTRQMRRRLWAKASPNAIGLAQPAAIRKVEGDDTTKKEMREVDRSGTVSNTSSCCPAGLTIPSTSITADTEEGALERL